MTKLCQNRYSTDYGAITSAANALHQVVIWKHAQITEMRIVYYCSSRANASPSLKDCLETGPPLKPSLFHIILRNRIRKYCVNGDIQKAFLEIRVQGRNAQPVLRQRVWEHHIGSYLKPIHSRGDPSEDIQDYKEEFTGTAELLIKESYVHDIQWRGQRSHLNAFRRRTFFARVAQNCGEFEFRETSERKLKRHTPRKWWRTRETGKPKFLEPPWDKQRDTSCIEFETFLKAAKPLTKWKMICAVKSIYEVLS